MMLEPAKYPQLIITHMDDSETVIHLTDADAYTWLPTTDGLMVRRVTGRTVFPWQTVKCYTIVPIADKYLPSDLPQPQYSRAPIDLITRHRSNGGTPYTPCDSDACELCHGQPPECAVDYAGIVDEIRRTARDADAYPRNTVRCDHNVEPGFYCTACHSVDNIKDAATRWAARRGHDTEEWTGPIYLNPPPGRPAAWDHTKLQVLARAYGAPEDVEICTHGWMSSVCPTCTSSK